MAGEVVQRSVLPSAEIMSADQFDQTWRLAVALVKSHMFKDVATENQAFARILLGADLGLSPTQALMNLDVVEGNARIRSVLLAAWVRKSEDYDYKVVEHDALHCAIEFFYKGEMEGRSEFSIEDATLAGLVKPDKPRSAWMAHPRNMLWARAMSNGVRWYCPDLTGGIPVYTEADEFVESTAVEIGQGEGDGSVPEWSGFMADGALHGDEEREARVGGLVAWAESKNLPLFGDLATVRMRLNGQSVEVVDEWIAAAEEQKAAVEDGES
jgi:hypothetical protein